MLAHVCRGCAETYMGPLWFVLVLAGLLGLAVWLINKAPRYFSRKAELEDRNATPVPKPEHRHYQFDDHDRLIEDDRKP